MLISRRDTTESEFVFPGTGTRGHLISPKKSKAKIVDATGIAFSFHDLRRTFSTVAESLDIPAYALKRLLNHSDGADVTAGYIVVNVERLRGPMETIADYMLRAMKVAQKIYSFEDRPHATLSAVHPS
jgi:integrase